MNYTVNISLPKQLAELAQEQVKKGYYSSFSEVVREALRHLFEPKIPEYQLSKKAISRIEKALKDYKNGNLKPISSLSELE
ncbi:MAG: hypothetical protein UR52_C0015G0012 [Candidatus Gottesmanbacteria bacterium GW2011_GWA1_34_13]|uniref:Ribbon-helix-helix protein CopG domain-containing protein n=1 Tax=Candidatus Gottesmanbacteria bacterium GW2011_GWA1_34_13 TaxID=1618434 RepID=A0A0G0B5M1_9BACT|nr:MAG: hypothetical protein UR52_C0015G0012 [Candidatus Gottesmanbacteria bacterium GW2011_GWA1_34_13]